MSMSLGNRDPIWRNTLSHTARSMTGSHEWKFLGMYSLILPRDTMETQRNTEKLIDFAIQYVQNKFVVIFGSRSYMSHFAHYGLAHAPCLLILLGIAVYALYVHNHHNPIQHMAEIGCI